MNVSQIRQFLNYHVIRAAEATIPTPGRSGITRASPLTAWPGPSPSSTLATPGDPGTRRSSCQRSSPPQSRWDQMSNVLSMSYQMWGQSQPLNTCQPGTLWIVRTGNRVNISQKYYTREPRHRYRDVFFSCCPCAGFEYSSGLAGGI